MLILLVISGIVSVIMLFLFIMQKKEIKNITKQISTIKNQDTNELLHSSSNIVSHKLINEINDLLKELRKNKIVYNQKSHRLEQMITNISHDLRTPLTSAMGYINIIMNSDLPDEEKEKEIHIVYQRMIRLEELIDSFFEFSKIISGDKAPEKQLINIVEVLQESVSHYYDDFCSQIRKVEFVCKNYKIMINSNYNMLMRIFDNLIGNAYKHGEGNLIVKVTGNDNVSITFENELNDSQIDIRRIFDEFYTTDISRTKGNTGLGLAIARQFTEILGGKIYAKYNKNIFSIIVDF